MVEFFYYLIMIPYALFVLLMIIYMLYLVMMLNKHVKRNDNE